MDYQEADKIRKKSFGTLLGEQEGGLGSSLKSAISQKTKAKITGIKETFDPMNMARAVGGKTGAAIYGKIFKRDDASMERFAGAKKKKTVLNSSDGANLSEASTPSDVLGLIYRLMLRADEEKKTQEAEDLQKKKTDEDEENDRNEQIIKAITGRGKKKPTRKEKAKEKKEEVKEKKEAKKEEKKAPPTEEKKAPPKEKGKKPSAEKVPTKEAPKQPPKEAPKEAPKAPKEAPKEIPKAPPKEAPKEAPKAPKEAPKEIPKAPPKEAVSTAQKVATGTAIVGAGAKGLVIGALIAAGFPKEAQANILANVDEESRFKPRSEELGKYSAKTLYKLFGPPGVDGGQPAGGKNKVRFNSMADAQTVVSKGPEAIGDVIYGGRMGNTSPGDGFKYRGRGFIQITGKDMYKSVGDKIGVDLVSNPDLANEPNIAAKIVPVFFQLKLGKRKPEDLKNIDTVNQMVGSASESSRAERKKLASMYQNQDLGSQIDTSSKENKDLKQATSNDVNAQTINSTTNVKQQSSSTIPTQSGDDRNAYLKKAQG